MSSLKSSRLKSTSFYKWHSISSLIDPSSLLYLKFSSDGKNRACSKQWYKKCDLYICDVYSLAIHIAAYEEIK